MYKLYIIYTFKHSWAIVSRMGAHNQSFEQTPERGAALREWFSGGAAQFKRVCRAWHKTREVKVLLPGIRRAEG